MSIFKCFRLINSNILLENRCFVNSFLNQTPIKFNLNNENFLDQFTLQKRFKFKTVKKRLTHKLSWWAKKTTKINYKANLTLENQKFVQEYFKNEYSSPLQEHSIQPKQWTTQSKRVGLIARKIGILPFWFKDGRKVMTTLLEVLDNHVIKYYDVNKTKSEIIIQDRWKTDQYASMVVGAESGDVSLYTNEYCSLFRESGVPPKKKITKMIITEDAMLLPGTPLYAQHFMVGQYVDVMGKSIDRGFQGVVKRWGFKGDGPKHHGASKFKRRGGSIGQSRKIAGPMKGRKMPGHMGDKRIKIKGLEVLRINTKHNVIFLKGQSIPGKIGSWVYIYDTTIKEKSHTVDNPPPFPTYIPTGDVPEDIYSPKIHLNDDETIKFAKIEEVKRRTGAKLAKVRK